MINSTVLYFPAKIVYMERLIMDSTRYMYYLDPVPAVPRHLILWAAVRLPSCMGASASF